PEDLPSNFDESTDYDDPVSSDGRTLKEKAEVDRVHQGGRRATHAALVNYESLLDYFGERSSDVGKPSSAENYHALRVLEDIYDRVLPVHTVVQAPGLLVSTV
ncbi:hypothetical protein FOZ63_016237, partial [Perkinsus olseni]